MTISHRRAVDKVRSSQSATDREAKYGASSQDIDHDSVSDEVDSRLEAEAVVRCLETLTETQQESVRLAYYGGLTYREVAEKLNAASSHHQVPHPRRTDPTQDLPGGELK